MHGKPLITKVNRIFFLDYFDFPLKSHVAISSNFQAELLRQPIEKLSFFFGILPIFLEILNIIVIISFRWEKNWKIISFITPQLALSFRFLSHDWCFCLLFRCFCFDVILSFFCHSAPCCILNCVSNSKRTPLFQPNITITKTKEKHRIKCILSAILLSLWHEVSIILSRK